MKREMLRKPQVYVAHRRHIPEKPFAYTSRSRGIIRRMLEEAFTQLGFSPNTLRNQSVLLKPNLVRPDLHQQPTLSTDPRVIVALVEVLRDHGVKQISVGENPGYGYRGREGFRKGELDEPLRRLGVNVCCFDEEQTVRIDNPAARLLKRVYVARSLADAEFIINVPKMKTHVHTQVSLGLKNWQGILLDPQRRIFHRQDIHQKIVDTYIARKPDLTIIDGIWAMEGQAPFFGTTIRNFNVLVVGRDGLLTDSVAAYLMGFFPDEVDTLRIAVQMELGRLDWGVEQILGVDPDKIRRFFRRPVLSSSGVFPNICVIEGGACSGCLSAVRHSLDKIRFEERLKDLRECTIYVGKPMPNTKNIQSWQGSLWLVGNCAADLVFSHPRKRNSPHYIPGCAPHVLDLYDRILDET